MHRVRVTQTEPGGSWRAQCLDCGFDEYASTRKVAREERTFHRQQTRENLAPEVALPDQPCILDTSSTDERSTR